jgi:hypothetical protein
VEVKSLFRNRPVQHFLLVARKFHGAENSFDFAHCRAKLFILVFVSQAVRPSSRTDSLVDGANIPKARYGCEDQPQCEVYILGRILLPQTEADARSRAFWT